MYAVVRKQEKSAKRNAFRSNKFCSILRVFLISSSRVEPQKLFLRKKKNVQKFIYHCRTVDQVYLNHAWNAGNKVGPTRTGMTNGLHGLLHALLLLQPLDLPLGLGASRVVFIC